MVTVRMALVRRDGETAGAFKFDFSASIISEIKAAAPSWARWWDSELRVWLVRHEFVEQVVAKLEASAGGYVVQVRRDASLARAVVENWKNGLGVPWPKAPDQARATGAQNARAARTATWDAGAAASPRTAKNAQPGANGETGTWGPTCRCAHSSERIHAQDCPRYLFAVKLHGGWACLGCLSPKNQPCRPLCSVACRCPPVVVAMGGHALGCPRRNEARDHQPRVKPGPRFQGFDEFFWAYNSCASRPPRTAPDPRPPGEARRVPLELATPDDYRLLGVQPGADLATAKAAYRKMAMTCHPDRGGDQEVAKRVNVAFDRIKNTLEVGA